MNGPKLALKIDIDTEIGTKIGVPNLLQLLKELKIPATFYASLGPDNTGRAVKRIFRKGFFKKVSRTSVVSIYGIKTLLNGILIPGPYIGKKHTDILRSIKEQGFDIGIHSYDHQKWQDGAHKMSQKEFSKEFQKALDEFQRIFGEPATTAAAPGWQANKKTLTAYDQAGIKYASDCRGISPFYSVIGDKTFNILQIPTTLPTLDELLGRPEFPLENLTKYYLSLLKSDQFNVLTLHPELEGMKYLDWFRSMLIEFKNNQVNFMTLKEIAKNTPFPTTELIQGEIDGRSGKLALQNQNRTISPKK